MFQSRIRIAVMTALAFALTFLLHWMMEWTVHTYTLGNEITEGLLSAAIAGVLVFHICLVAYRRRLKYERRVEAVLTLNHHVRNALQAMVPFIDAPVTTPGAGLQHAIDRIDWVLRDVEPHLTQHEAEYRGRRRPWLRPGVSEATSALGRRVPPS